MSEVELQVAVPGHGTVEAILARPDTPARCALTLSQGAGGTMRSDFVVAARKGLAARGHVVLAHNFPFSQAGRGRPDQPAVLETTVRAAQTALREAAPGLAVVLAGKSLGARIASRTVAAGDPADGLLFFGYPLHPPGRPDRLRTDHWPDITVPALFIEGTRDPFCDLALLRRELASFAGAAEIVEIEGGDHSFRVPRSAGVPQAEVLEHLWDIASAWLDRICGG